MKRYTLIIMFTLLSSLTFVIPNSNPIEPGQNQLEVPLDGGILLALLAGGGITAVFFNKKKNDNK